LSRVGAVTIAGYVVGDNLGLDQLLFGARLGGNRIAPNTGVNFLFLGIALLLLDWQPRPGVWPAQLVLLAPITISATSLLGYVYGVGALYGIARYIPMALPTAIAFLALSLGALWARPQRGLVAVVTADHPGGVLARRLLPAAVVIPVLLGWLRLVSDRRELMPPELGLAMTVVLTILLFTVLIWATSRFLNRVDEGRKAGEDRLVTQYATTSILAEAPTLSDALPRILEAITDRTLPPGHRIRQNELAEKLGVSRQPVSHALHLLHRQGLVAESGQLVKAKQPLIEVEPL